MNRREFFRRGVGAGAGAVVRGGVPPGIPHDSLDYRGWTIRWSGWQQSPWQDLFIGFWFARRDEVRVYSCTGGVVAPYTVGAALNVTSRHDWPWITSESTEHDRIGVKARAYNQLMQYLGEHHAALYPEQVCTSAT